MKKTTIINSRIFFRAIPININNPNIARAKNKIVAIIGRKA